MVERQQARQDARLDAVFSALSHRTRREMLRRLSHGERSIGELAEPFDMSFAAASKHVKALEVAGLVQRDIRGRMHVCRLDAAPLSSANDWLRHYEQFWSASLDRLEDLLRGQAPAAAPKPSSTRKRP